MEKSTLGFFVLVLTIVQTSNSLVEGLESTRIYDYTKYHPMDEIYKWMEDVERENPELVSSAVYGRTFEGKNITLLKTRLWRKSRSTPPSGNSCLGVDLNRNFNANWGTVGVSFDSCANTYCGKEAGSEPEATAVMDFVGKMVSVGKAAAAEMKKLHGMGYTVGTSPQILWVLL
ncbi:Carboxypeptidase O [Dissostichus eleginoides]|uniref:Carboxypeptidase O n=1 Tax=Dissostichus eleginoides TaxID=100907 RepID=A0AAD9FLT3_DISEL|nr:Carboxypeptidase O [Dissostichus eleginoides]